MVTPMAVKTEILDEWLVVLKVDGELDAYLAPYVRQTVEEVLEGGARWVLLDLMAVDYLDSVGLGIMVGAAQRASERGGDLAVACVRAIVLRVLEISGTKDLLNVVGSVEEARARLEAAHAAAETPQGGEE
jgi:anti-sigma B factor antagonist